eukprot:Rhum_TRINITY_DN2669_c0_g1::Rhum_TRINITY_DN2669_c0_g1_i1::g.7890::m.7890
MLPVSRVPSTSSSSSAHRRSTSVHPFPLLPLPPPPPRSAAATAAAAGLLLAACLLASVAVCTRVVPAIDSGGAAPPRAEAGPLPPNDDGGGDIRCPDPGRSAPGSGLYTLQTGVAPRGVRALTLPLEAQREVCEGLRQRVQAADADAAVSPPETLPGLLVVIPANAAHLSMAVSSLCTLAAASPAAAARAVLLALDAEALRAALEKLAERSGDDRAGGARVALCMLDHAFLLVGNLHPALRSVLRWCRSRLADCLYCERGCIAPGDVGLSDDRMDASRALYTGPPPPPPAGAAGEAEAAAVVAAAS